MTKTLILKEIRQHWLALLGVGLILGLGFFLVLAASVMQDSGSHWDALLQYLRSLVPLSCLVICSRLVVKEYQSKTQLFLEGLPLTRIHMVTVKYLFGFAIATSAVAAAFLILIPISSRSEQLSARFLQILAIRTFSYTWCVYAFFFLMGLLGRYRVAIYIQIIITMSALEGITDLELARFGPFALVNDQFSYERVDFPTAPVQITLAMAAGFTTLTLLLATLREGSVATLLAEKMSYREKVFIAVIAVGSVFALSVYDEKRTKEPFDLPDSLVEREGNVTVKLSITADNADSAGRELAELICREISQLQEYLQIDEVPPIFIVQSRDLDEDRYERAKLDGADGLLVRGNFLGETWDKQRFLSWVVRELLIVASGNRVTYEPHMWVLDGFAQFWVTRSSGSAPQYDQQLQLRAAYGGTRGFSTVDIEQWYSFRERVGADIAAAIARAGIQTLAEVAGESATQQFLREALDPDIPPDLRALMRQWLSPAARILHEQTGISYQEFVSRWTGTINNLRRSHRHELDGIPELDGRIKFNRVSEATRTVSFELKCSKPPEDRQFRLLFSTLPVFDALVADHDVHLRDLTFPDEATGELERSYARGTRFYSTFSLRVDRLGCDIISGWTRQQMH